MVYVYEPWASGQMHIGFNSSFLKSLSIAYNNDQIIYYGAKTQIYELEQILSARNIRYRSIAIPDYDIKGGKFSKIMIESANQKKLSRTVDKNIIIIENALPHVMAMGNYYFRGKNVIYIMHNHLEAILRNDLRPTNMDYYMKSALLHLDRNAKLVVLGDSIRDYLLGLYPQLEECTFSMRHPWINKVKLNHEYKYRESGNVRIGTIGFGAKKKGLLQMNRIAKVVQEKNLPIELAHIGKIEKDLIAALDSSIRIPFKTEHMVPADEMNKEIDKLDFVLFLYPPDSYRLTASGALLEALDHQKPLISLRNDYFNSVLGEFSFHTGFVYKDVNELLANITSLLEISNEEYQKMCDSCSELLEEYSPEKVAMHMRRIF